MGCPALLCPALLCCASCIREKKLEQNKPRNQFRAKLKLNSKRNRFGWFGRLGRRGVGEKKKKHPPQSGAGGQSSYYNARQSSYYNALEIIKLSQDNFANAPVYGKPYTLDPQPSTPNHKLQEVFRRGMLAAGALSMMMLQRV